MNKKNIIIAVFSLVLIGVLTFAASDVNAGWFGFDNTGFISNFAKKLGIGEDKVTQALDSIQSERQKEMKTRFEERLTQLVKDGKITENQKQAILKKHDELQTKRTAERQEMQNWAKQNGLENFHSFGGIGHGMRGGWMMK